MPPDIVCGASMGALVGAAYVLGRLPALYDWALAYKRREAIKLMDLRLSNGGLLGSRKLVQELLDLDAEQRIEDMATPFACVATDLVHGREVWLREGPLLDAIAASIAIPGIFSPIKVGETWMIDGAVVDPVPVGLCRTLGADRIIAVDPNRGEFGRRTPRFAREAGERRSTRKTAAALQSIASRLPADSNLADILLRSRSDAIREGIPKYFDVLVGSLHIMQDYITRSRMAGDPPDILLTPRLSDINFLEFDRAAEAVAEGRASIERILPTLAAMVG
jgi:NTE family protein